MADGTNTPALSDARQRLAAAITALQNALAAREQILQPGHRLRRVLVSAAGVIAQRDALQTEEDKRLVEWMLDQKGPPPVPSIEFAAAERRAAVAAREKRAAEVALLDCEERGREETAAIEQAVEARDTALFEVLREDCRLLGQVAAERFRSALAVDAELATVAQVMLDIANEREVTSSAQSGARMTVDVIAAVRNESRDASARRPPAPVRNYLDRLRDDAGATFQVPA